MTCASANARQSTWTQGDAQGASPFSFRGLGVSPELHAQRIRRRAQARRQATELVACYHPAVTDLPLAEPKETPDWRPAIFSALLALGLFAVTLGGTYIYDDITIIQINPRVHEPARWFDHWTEGYGDSVDNLYRPLVTTSYAIQWWLFAGFTLVMAVRMARGVARV